MAKRLCKLVILIQIVLAISVFSGNLACAEAVSLSAKAAVLMDAKTGQVLYEKNMHKHNPPASTTKILTAIIAIESGHLDDTVTVSPKAAATPGSSMNLFSGQKISLRELITGLLLRSGNDAAVAIAEHLAGSVEAFVDIMNHKAQIIGAVNSNFKNPHGLATVGHYSTAYDLAWIARYAMLNPFFASIVNTKETNIDWFDRRGREHDQSLRNTNKLLWMFSDADGVKTGTTSEAGPCLVSSATRGNQKLIAVVLHDHARWQESMQLLKYGFDNFDVYEYANAGDLAGVIAVEDGLLPEVDVIMNSQPSLVVPTKDFPYIAVEVDIPEKIKAPVYKGQKVGEVVFYMRDKAVKTIDVVAANDIEERTVTRIFLNNLTHFFRLLSTWEVL